MNYRKLGMSGLNVSEVGLGCNNFGMLMNQQETNNVVSCAIDTGITLFDTADVYGNKGKSEIFLGKALQKKRDKIVLATKFGLPMSNNINDKGGSRRYIINAVEQSLKRLKTDYIDLYQIHRPDIETPIEETLKALNDLIIQGKIRYIGCSNFSGWQLVESRWKAEIFGLDNFISAQNGYSVINREIENDLTYLAQKYSVGILPYFPLESGLLTGKYKYKQTPKKGTRLSAWSNRKEVVNKFWSQENFNKVEKLNAISKKNNHSLIELAFGWLLNKEYVSSVIAGATKVSQVKQNVKAGLYKITKNEISEINKITDITTNSL